MSVSSEMTLLQCRGIANNVLSRGLHNALQTFLDSFTRLLQAKQDQMDNVVAASLNPSLVPHTGFDYSIATAFSSADYLAFRDLGSHGLWPAYRFVVRASVF